MLYLGRWRFDEHRIVDGGADSDTRSVARAARQTQHLGSVRLHREICERSRRWNLDRRGRASRIPFQASRVTWHGRRSTGTTPRIAGRLYGAFAVSLGRAPCAAQPLRKRSITHTILNAQDAGLELLAHRSMRGLGSITGDRRRLALQIPGTDRPERYAACMAMSPDRAAAIPNSCWAQSM